MNSRIRLAQDDFSSLKLAVEQNSNKQPLDECAYDGYATIERAASGDSRKSESACKSEEMYRPVHFIADEVYELIQNWDDHSCLKRQEIAPASMDTNSFGDSRSSRMRCISESAPPPPKVFYISFWRSITRRMVRRQMQSAIKLEER